MKLLEVEIDLFVIDMGEESAPISCSCEGTGFRGGAVGEREVGVVVKDEIVFFVVVFYGGHDVREVLTSQVQRIRLSVYQLQTRADRMSIASGYEPDMYSRTSLNLD